MAAIAPHTLSPDGRRPLLEEQREQIIGLLMLLAGVVLLVAPWLLGQQPTAGNDGHRNELGVGLVVVFTAAVRFTHHAGWLNDLIIFAAGVWIAVAPWAFELGDNSVSPGSRALDHGVGYTLVGLAVLSRLMSLAVRHRETRRSRA
jgi:hypothetical protein